MVRPSESKDNVIEFGIPETARLEFEPAEELKRSIAEMLTDEYKTRMGHKALFLYSDFAQSVRRRNGVVIGEDGPLESEIDRIVRRAPTQPKLARYINAERGRDITRNVNLYVLRMAVRLDTNTIRAIQDSKTISSRFLNGLTVPVRAAVPAEALLPLDARKKPIDDLVRLVLSKQDEDEPLMDLRAEALDPHAAVKNMQMVFREVRQ